MFFLKKITNCVLTRSSGYSSEDSLRSLAELIDLSNENETFENDDESMIET
jgi:hypothetical protein